MAKSNQGSHSIDDLWTLLIKIQENISNITKEVENFKTAFKAYDKEINELKNENKAMRERVESLERDFKYLETSNDSLEQYTRKSSLVIVGIPTMKDRSCEEIVLKVAEKIGVHLKSDDIDITHPIFSKNENPPILVKFLSHKKKSQLYRARTKLKGIKVADIFDEMNTAAGRVKTGIGNIYINENLTTYRKNLMSRALRMRKSGEITSVWSLDGKIYVKTTATAYPTKIFSHEDLDYIY